MRLFKNHKEELDDLLCICVVVFIIGFFIIYFDKLGENNKENKMKEVQYIETIRYATDKEQIDHDRKELEMIAKLVYGEARGCSKTEQAAVIWCVLNRVDSSGFPDNITDVIIQKNQFSGYNENHPIYEEYIELANDVLTRWKFEQTAVGEVGRVLPKEYTYFRGDGVKNTFRDAYKEPYNTWDWTLESPYKEG